MKLLLNERTPLVSLLGANAISQLGSMVTFVALPWFVLQTTGSASQAGITLAVESVPVFVGGLFGGALVDRVGYKQSSVVSDVASGVMVGAIPLVYMTVGIRFWQLLLLVFLASLVNQPGRNARSSIVPDLAERAKMPLVRANSLTQAVRRGALLFGPPMAGLLITFLGSSRVLWIDALSYIVSALLVAIGVHHVSDIQAPSEQSMMADTLEGIRYIVRDRLLLSISLVASIMSLISEPLYTIVYPVYARQVYHSPVTLGLMYSALAIGSLGGLGVYTLFGPRMPQRVVLLGGFVVQASSFWVLAMLPSRPILLGSIAINALCFEPINPLVTSLLQERTPAGMRGRVFGTFSAIAIGTLPVGTLIGGLLLNGPGLVPTLLTVAVASTALTCGVFLIPAFHHMPQTMSATTEANAGQPVTTV